jgi:hypothetical protein
MSFSRFLWMLQRKRLWLARADTFADPWELAIAGDQLAYVIARHPPEPIGERREPAFDRTRRINKLWRETTYVSCWCASEYESHALWRIFCGPAEGIAIRTSLPVLTAALDNLVVRNVTYCDPGSEASTPNLIDLAARKRRMFDYEKEVRVIATANMSNPRLIKGEIGLE